MMLAAILPSDSVLIQALMLRVYLEIVANIFAVQSDFGALKLRL